MDAKMAASKLQLSMDPILADVMRECFQLYDLNRNGMLPLTCSPVASEHHRAGIIDSYEELNQAAARSPITSHLRELPPYAVGWLLSGAIPRCRPT